MEEYKNITDYPDVRSAIRYAEKRAREEGREEIIRVFTQECALRGFSIEEIAKLTHLTVGQVMKFPQNPQ
jgi:predicted transposase YdaD